MSSILDALNKLEQEKAAAQAVDVVVDPALAAQELLGQDILRDRVAVQVRPVSLIAAFAAFSLVLVGLSVWISLVLRPVPATPTESFASGSAAAERVAVLRREPEPETGPMIPEFTNVGVAMPVPEPAAEVSLDPVPISDPPDTDAGVGPSVSQPSDVSEMPVPEFTNVAVVAPVREQVARTETVESVEEPSKGATESASGSDADEPPVLPEDAHTLPILSSAIREMYNLGDLKLNMVWPADLSGSYGRPYDLALINRMKVQVGDRIPATNVRLVKVERDGVAIQVIGTLKYFFIPL
ncbi:MAG: hypothetical protein IID08_04775 [Candidatus Hydrogenedentes bacterium]|nr:hypothetical protein [Candidatus Hydrogenedentota bacterium]